MTCHKGFTLLELLVAMALSMIIIAAGYFFYNTQVSTRVTQDRVTDMQQNLRAAMTMMGGDIRMAGYDPEGTTKAGFTAATADALSFEISLDAETNGLDDDGNGETDEPEEAERPMTLETITYRLTGQNLVRIVRGKEVVVAENMQALELNYVLEDGSTAPAPTDLSRIVAVRIALLARSQAEDSGFSNSAEYRGYTQTWGVYNDGYRRRLLMRTVSCRNRGVE